MSPFLLQYARVLNRSMGETKSASLTKINRARLSENDFEVMYNGRIAS